MDLNKKRTFFEIFLNIVSLLTSLGIIVYLIMEWSSLPNQVPSHYNEMGEVTRWGKKGELLILPLLGLIIWIVTTIIERVHSHRDFRISINLIKNETVIIFAFLTWNDIQVAKSVNSHLNFWVILSIVLILFSTVVFFVVKSRNDQTHNN